MRKIEAFCDGACKGNPGYGGWGVAVFETVNGNDFCWQRYGGKKMTTNQEMELKAMLEALKLCSKGAQIKITGDNQTVLKGLINGGVSGTITSKKGNAVFSGWIGGWTKTSGISGSWKKADGKPPSSLELWRCVAQECNEHIKAGSTLEFAWTKGHNGDPGNELADELANKGAAEFK